MFGVPTSLFGQDALDLFGEDITRGRFYHFTTGSELIFQIKSKHKKWTGEKYIETNPKFAKNAMKEILSEKNRI